MKRSRKKLKANYRQESLRLDSDSTRIPVDMAEDTNLMTNPLETQERAIKKIAKMALVAILPRRECKKQDPVK